MNNRTKPGPEPFPIDADTLKALARGSLGGIKVAAHERDDLIQDAVLKVLADPPAAPVREPASYLRRVMRNLLVDRIRERVRRTRLAETLLALTDRSRDDTARVVEAQQRLAQVNRALDTLSPRCAEAFRLHREDGLTYSQIAKRMGISVSAVEKHVAEALYRIAKCVAGGDEPRGD